MESLYFNDYYSGKYKSTDPQVKLTGFKYGSGSGSYRSTNGLTFLFENENGRTYTKTNSNTLELLILIEILNGSKLWILSASVSNERIGTKVDMNPMFIKDFMDKSLAYSAFFDQTFNQSESYSRYGGYPDISQKSFISYLDPIQQPSNFKVNLFEYQKKSIAKMIAMEKGEINMFVDYTFNFNLKLDNNVLDSEEEDMITDDVVIKYDPFKGKIDECKNCLIKVTSKGGILCDEMGLGKTITSLSLVVLNPSTFTQQYKENLIYSNATLIICPSHLAKQWEGEVKKVIPDGKIIKLLTKNNHVKLTYKEVMDANIIIVTQQFLMNFKYYPQVHYQYCTPSNFSFDSRINHLTSVLQGWKDDANKDITKELQPNLEHFYFHRLIVDEGHEIFGMNVGNHSMAEYMSKWLSKINSSYKWFVSGTPFINNIGLVNSLNFIGTKIFDSSGAQMNYDNSIIMKRYIMDKILSKLLIRHRKCDVENQIQIPGYEEEVIWVKLTDLEKNLYNSKKSGYVSDIVLQQLCCHILVSDTTQKYFGNTEVDLEVMQDKLIEYHKDTITKYTHKLNTLDPVNQAYAMLKKTYSSKISESKYMLSILEKINKKDEIDLEQNCSICFDTLTNPSLTPCGHVFCKECLELCLQAKKECPMCKADLAGKEIYLVDSKKNEIEVEPEEMNPLIKKYGSKLGKLISIVRTITADENNRVIIFSQWDRMLNLIGKSLSDNGVENSFVKGNVWARNSAISKFKIGKDGKGNDSKVIMLSLSNSASGTNLTEASHIIFVEPINTSHDEMKAIEGQAIGRACRLGQNNKIKVIRILTQNTIEQDIYDNIYAKNKDNIKRVVKVDDGTLENEVVV